jgi:hypothetical protein
MPQKKTPHDLAKLTRIFFEKTTSSSIYKRIVTNACTVLNASAALLILHDRNERKLLAVQASNLSEQYLNAARKDFTIARAAFKERRTKVVHDIKETYGTSDRKTVDLAKKQGISSFVSAPLLANGEALGCLNIYFGRPIRYSRKKEMIELFVNVCALALVHNRLSNRFDESTRVMAGLQNIGGLFSSPFNKNELIQVILRTVVNLTNTDSASILLIDEEHKSILDAYDYDKRTKKVTKYQSTARLEQGFSGEILRSRKALAVSDLKTYRKAFLFWAYR